MTLEEYLKENISQLKKEYELINVKDVDAEQGVSILLSDTTEIETLLNDRPIVKFLGFTIVAKEVEPGTLYLYARKDAELNGGYYFFDCLGLLFNGDRTGLPDNFIPVRAFKDDQEAISTATNYEATLYRYEYKDGEIVSSATLYEPQF